jgi:protein SCO1/2
MKVQFTTGIVLAAALLLAAPHAARAQAQRSASAYAGTDEIEAGMPAAAKTSLLKQVGFDQRLNAQVPLDLPFTDAAGRDVTIGQYLGQRPVVLALVYFNCPMLCTQVLDGAIAAFRALSLEPGKDYDFLAVSFDPREKPKDAEAKRQVYVKKYGAGPGADGGFHFLTGDESAIEALTKAVGFRYVWDPSIGQFAHPTGIVVLTPTGHVARYLFGVQYAARDLRLSLVEASQNQIGTKADELLLYCYHYDPSTGKYGLLTMRLLRIAGGLTILALGAFIFIMWRMEKRGSHHAIPPDQVVGSAASGRKA